MLVFQQIDHVSVSPTDGIGPTQGQRSDQSFPLSLCGLNSISRANAHMVYGLKYQHFILLSITLFVLKLGAHVKDSVLYEIRPIFQIPSQSFNLLQFVKK